MKKSIKKEVTCLKDKLNKSNLNNNIWKISKGISNLKTKKIFTVRPSKITFRHFPPAIKQWVNSIYSFNKNLTKNLPNVDKIVNKIIRSFFSINALSNNKGKKKKLIQRIWKRKTLNRILVSKPEIKHSNEKVFITVFIFNKKKKSLILKLKKLYKNITYNNKILTSNNKLRNNNKSYKDNIFNNILKYINKYYTEKKSNVKQEKDKYNNIFIKPEIEMEEIKQEEETEKIWLFPFQVGGGDLYKDFTLDALEEDKAKNIKAAKEVKKVQSVINQKIDIHIKINRDKKKNSNLNYINSKAGANLYKLINKSMINIIRFKLIDPRTILFRSFDDHLYIKSLLNEFVFLDDTINIDDKKKLFNTQKFTPFWLKLLQKEKSYQDLTNSQRNTVENSNIYNNIKVLGYFYKWTIYNNYFDKEYRENLNEGIKQTKLKRKFVKNRVSLKNAIKNFILQFKNVTNLTDTITLNQVNSKKTHLVNKMIYKKSNNKSKSKYKSKNNKFNIRKQKHNNINLNYYGNNSNKKKSPLHKPKPITNNIFNKHIRTSNLYKNYISRGYNNYIIYNKLKKIDIFFNKYNVNINKYINNIFINYNNINDLNSTLSLDNNRELLNNNNITGGYAPVPVSVNAYQNLDLVQVQDNNTILGNKDNFTYLYLKDLRNKFKKKLIKKFLKKEFTYLFYLRLLSFNNNMLKFWFLNPLKNILSKIYNKKVILNIVSLKYIHLNSDIFTQAILIRLKNFRRYRLNRILNKSIQLVPVSKINHVSYHIKKPLFKYLVKYRQNFKFLNTDIFQNKYADIYSNFKANTLNTRINAKFNLNNTNNLNNNDVNTFSLNRSSVLHSGLKTKPTNHKPYPGAYCSKGLTYAQSNIINFIKYKSVFGVRLEVAGRLTKRSTASRAIFKIKSRGNLRNSDTLNNSNYTILTKNYKISNLQYTKISSKTRNGAFGIKGWLNNN